MSMLEKLAAAIEAKVRPSMPMYDWDSTEIARSVLMAMREPTNEMLDAADDGISLDYPSPELAWQAMIDSILSEQPSPPFPRSTED